MCIYVKEFIIGFTSDYTLTFKTYFYIFFEVLHMKVLKDCSNFFEFGLKTVHEMLIKCSWTFEFFHFIPQVFAT